MRNAGKQERRRARDQRSEDRSQRSEIRGQKSAVSRSRGRAQPGAKPQRRKLPSLAYPEPCRGRKNHLPAFHRSGIPLVYPRSRCGSWLRSLSSFESGKIFWSLNMWGDDNCPNCGTNLKCPDCNGRGQLNGRLGVLSNFHCGQLQAGAFCTRCGGRMPTSNPSNCPSCQGTGRIKHIVCRGY